jgi:hypothetical protein
MLACFGRLTARSFFLTEKVPEGENADWTTNKD